MNPVLEGEGGETFEENSRRILLKLLLDSKSLLEFKKDGGIRIKKEENLLPTTVLEVLMVFPIVTIFSVKWYFKFSTNIFFSFSFVLC